MSINAEDVFNPKDFQSISLQITMKNLTTQTEIKDPGVISLVELGDKKITVEFPAKSCNIKHNVFLDIKKKDSQTEYYDDLCSLTGKVVEAEAMEPSELRAVIDVIQVDELSWKKLQEIFTSRQEQITEFLRAVRG